MCHARRNFEDAKLHWIDGEVSQYNVSVCSMPGPSMLVGINIPDLDDDNVVDCLDNCQNDWN